MRSRVDVSVGLKAGVNYFFKLHVLSLNQVCLCFNLLFTLHFEVALKMYEYVHRKRENQGLGERH